MEKYKVRIYHHPVFEKHVISPGHPEQPARIPAIFQGIEELGIGKYLEFKSAEKVSRDILLKAHSAQYLDMLDEASPQTGYRVLDADTGMNPATLEAAYRAAGAACEAAREVGSGKIERVFCLSRPPGHHARRTHAAGFCFFGNVALAALLARDENLFQRIAIVDWDVHHGDGTQSIIGHQDGISLFSIQQRDNYPYNWDEQDNPPPNVTNVSLPGGTRREAFMAAFRKEIVERLEKLDPDLILISAGFDAHKDDPLGGFSLEDQDYAEMTETLIEICPKIVSVLEGGYNLDVMRQAVPLHIQAMMRGR